MVLISQLENKYQTLVNKSIWDTFVRPMAVTLGVCLPMIDCLSVQVEPTSTILDIKALFHKSSEYMTKSS